MLYNAAAYINAQMQNVELVRLFAADSPKNRSYVIRWLTLPQGFVSLGMNVS